MGTFASHLKELAQMAGAVEAEGVATAGTANSLSDGVELGSAATDQFSGKRIYIFEGPNLGQERPIIDSVSPGAVAWTYAMPAAITTASKYIILRSGWTMSMLRTALLNALRRRRRDLLLPKVDESLTIDMDPAATYEYTVPTGFVAIQSILRELVGGDASFIVELQPEWWYISKAATKKIVFDKGVNSFVNFLHDGCKLRIIGQQYQTEPDSDDDTLSIQTGNLLWLAVANAYNMRSPADSGDAEHFRVLERMALENFNSVKEFTSLWPGSRLVEDA